MIKEHNIRPWIPARGLRYVRQGALHALDHAWPVRCSDLPRAWGVAPVDDARQWLDQ